MLVSTTDGRSILCKQGAKSAKTPVASIIPATPTDKLKGATGLQLPSSGRLEASLLRVLTTEGEGEGPPCPWLEYHGKEEEWLRATLPVDCVGVFLRSAQLGTVGEGLLEAASRQLRIVLQRLAEAKNLEKVTCM